MYGGIRCSDIETVEQMEQWLDGGGHINSPFVSIFSETPLILQAIEGNTDVVKYLVKKGANINIGDEYNITPFHNICKYGHEDLFDYFVEKLGVNFDDTRSINFACSNNQVNIVKKLLNLGVKIDGSVGHGYQAIHHACYGGGNPDNSVEIVDHLILHGADLNVQNEQGETPLHLAVSAGNLKIIEKLLSMSADTTLVNLERKTALESLYYNNPHHKEITELFNKYITTEQ